MPKSFAGSVDDREECSTTVWLRVRPTEAGLPAPRRLCRPLSPLTVWGPGNHEGREVFRHPSFAHILFYIFVMLLLFICLWIEQMLSLRKGIHRNLKKKLRVLHNFSIQRWAQKPFCCNWFILHPCSVSHFFHTLAHDFVLINSLLISFTLMSYH